MVNQVGEQPVDHQVEEIPADHYVSRHIDLPHKYADDAGLIWQRVFEFPGGVGESVVWRQYKPSVAEVHALGCDRQDLKRSQYPEKNPPWTYIGAMTAQVQQLRAIETRRGHGFVVEHKPTREATSVNTRSGTVVERLGSSRPLGRLRTMTSPRWRRSWDHSV